MCASSSSRGRRHFLASYINPSTTRFGRSVPDAVLPSDEESLWEYLHRTDFELWSAQNYPLTPVIVLDQFEELFTLGERVPDLVRTTSGMSSVTWPRTAFPPIWPRGSTTTRRWLDDSTCVRTITSC